MLLIKREIIIAKLYVKLILGLKDGGRAIKKLNIKAKQTNAKLKIIIILSIARYDAAIAIGAKMINMKGLVYPPFKAIKLEICIISKHKNMKTCFSEIILSPLFK